MQNTKNLFDAFKETTLEELKNNYCYKCSFLPFCNITNFLIADKKKDKVIYFEFIIDKELLDFTCPANKFHKHKSAITDFKNEEDLKGEKNENKHKKNKKKNGGY